MQTRASKYAIWKTGKQNKDTDYIPKQSEKSTGNILQSIKLCNLIVQGRRKNQKQNLISLW
jgi:hypothetical protein